MPRTVIALVFTASVGLTLVAIRALSGGGPRRPSARDVFEMERIEADACVDEADGPERRR